MSNPLWPLLPHTPLPTSLPSIMHEVNGDHLSINCGQRRSPCQYPGLFWVEEEFVPDVLPYGVMKEEDTLEGLNLGTSCSTFP